MTDASTKNADYRIAIERVVERVGHANGHKLPTPNDPAHSAWQEYAVAKMLADAAEVRAKKARAAVLATVSNAVLGQFIAHDSPYAVAIAKVQRGQTRIDNDLLLNNIVKTFGVDVDAARAVLEASKKQGENIIVLNVTLRQ